MLARDGRTSARGDTTSTGSSVARLNWSNRTARVSSSAILVRIEVRSTGRKDKRQGTGLDKASGLCAKKMRDVRLGLEEMDVGS